MNRGVWLAASAALLCACAPAAPPEELTLDLGDFEDYAYWYNYERDSAPEPQPFEADPLHVMATGKIRAVPDVAVIVATVAAEDDNESRAVDRVSQQVNAVQAALTGRDVETGFTALRSRPDYDQACLNANRAAQQRQREIRNDYWFNRRLDEQGDTQTRRRPAKPRLSERVCQAQAIRISTDMVIRISPASDAGEVLRSLGEAGAERARLYGYDFSDFDALYQQAAEAAVRNARAKAEAVASGAKGELGSIVEMSVSAPSRLGRFGPQPTVIRPPRPRSGDGVTALDSYNQILAETRRRIPPAPPPPAMVYQESVDEIIVTAASVQKSQTLAPKVQSGVSASGGSELASASTGTNALTMSLMSGPQTIEVTARLSYAYPTLLDGIVIQDPDAPE